MQNLQILKHPVLRILRKFRKAKSLPFHWGFTNNFSSNPELPQPSNYYHFRVFSFPLIVVCLAIFVKHNNVYLKNFGYIIKSLRLKKGLLLREVAAEIEVDTSMVSKFEKGERIPSREQVQKIAAFFGVPEDDLIICSQSDKLASELNNEPLAINIIELTIQKLESNNENKKNKNL